MAIIMVTHDLCVVAEMADEVALMYAGSIVERASVADMFDNPQHPYTIGLLGSMPRMAAHRANRRNGSLRGCRHHRHARGATAPPAQKNAIAVAIVAKASLSFLGLGQQPPGASWGSTLNSAQRFMTQAPWLAVFPGLAVFLAVLAFNLMGDGLRDALDTHSR